MARWRIPPENLVRVIAGAARRVRDADHLQQLDGTFIGVVPADVLVCLDRFGDLLADPEQRVEACEGVLEDHRDAGAPDGTHLLLIEPEKILALELGPAGDLGARAQSHDRLRGDGLAGT